MKNNFGLLLFKHLFEFIRIANIADHGVDVDVE